VNFRLVCPWPAPIQCAFLAKDRHLRNLRDREAGSTCHFSFFCEYSEVTKLYVGNLPFTATEDSVRGLFTPHGAVEKVALITDRDTGQARGFGFVEMSNADASRAMQALNGTDFGGRALKINEAHDKERAGGGGNRGGARRY
jgi:RNA recognition motif-containing protein